ncbi:MAG: DSD1 family PLP-dependent enzyme [Planctomyces sp.]|nr:DSD1 family PLP-dependent enzyme [Planctomyces sp.]
MLAHLIGRHKRELDTPALCIDLDRMRSNIDAMASFLKQRGKQWRPHAKCHKTPVIAHRQIQAGAIGVTAAKVSEAEVFIDAGIPDVLVANMVVGEPKLERLAALTRRGDPIVAIDHFVQAEALDDVCRRRGTRCRVLLELNIGLNRVGIRPGVDAWELARGVARLKHITLAGIMGYEGHLLTIPDPEEKRAKIAAAMALLVENRDALEREGIPIGIVSAGGTGSYQDAADCPGITELQAGGGTFADPFYVDRCGVRGLEPALALIATVVSRTKRERAVLDCGRKSLHPDIHPPTIAGCVNGRPLPDAAITQFSAEHTTLELGPQSQDLRIGDKVELIPGYSDHTTPLHPVFYGLRNGVVDAVWPIAARGCIH